MTTETTRGTATYSPDDNKLRFYPRHRLSTEDYQRIRAAGFIWAAKQELFVAPMWTPGREDLLVDWSGEIEDEDKSLVDRAEERAERFEVYQEKRAGEAERAHDAVSQIVKHIPLGQPILIGHHSECRARKDAERIENGMRKAVKLWETSTYWKSRAAGALSHAKYKELSRVRARRIKTIEADQRKAQRDKAQAEKRLAFYSDPQSREVTRENGNLLIRDMLLSYEYGLSVCPVASHTRASLGRPIMQAPSRSDAMLSGLFRNRLLAGCHWEVRSRSARDHSWHQRSAHPPRPVPPDDRADRRLPEAHAARNTAGHVKSHSDVPSWPLGVARKSSRRRSVASPSSSSVADDQSQRLPSDEIEYCPYARPYEQSATKQPNSQGGSHRMRTIRVIRVSCFRPLAPWFWP